MDNEKLIFSALCDPDVVMPASDGSQMTLKVSKMTIEPREMNSSEVKDITENTSKAVEVTKSVLVVGKSSMLYKLKDEAQKAKWTKAFDVISGVGDIVKGVLRFVPGPENPMLQNLKNLTNHIGRLEKEISVSFDEMKALISEVNFFVKVMSPTIVLTRYMNNCLKYPGQDAVNNFKRAYESHPPIHLAYNLKSYLEINSTNPLKLALEAEEMKTTATFDKWENIILRILGQLFFIESFGSGIVDRRDEFNWDRMYDMSISIVNKMNDVADELRKDETSNKLYWEHFIKFLDPWVKESKGLSNAEKADAIKKQLDTYLTSDAFYVTVFDDHHNKEDNFWIQIKKEDQILQRTSPDGSKIIVYKSKLAFYQDQASMSQFKRELTVLVSRNMRNSLLSRLIPVPIPRAGFTILFGGLNEEIRGVNWPRSDRGPGWYTDDYDFGGPVERKLFAGFF